MTASGKIFDVGAVPTPLCASVGISRGTNESRPLLAVRRLLLPTRSGPPKADVRENPIGPCGSQL